MNALKQPAGQRPPGRASAFNRTSPSPARMPHSGKVLPAPLPQQAHARVAPRARHIPRAGSQSDLHATSQNARQGGSSNSGPRPQRPEPSGKVDFTSFFNIINGKQVKSAQTFRGINPATKEPLWEVPSASSQDIDRAVKAAAAAQKEWAKKSWKERQEFTLLTKSVYAKYTAELTNLMRTENGKPTYWAERDILSLNRYADFHAKLPIPTGEGTEDSNRKITTKFHPLGVVAAIVPWNYPLNMSFAKMFPALVAGNAVIIKPTEYSPYTTLKMVEILQQVFPPGLVQVLAGDGKVGQALVEHPGIHKISFTGSSETGKKVMAGAAATMKRVTLELGGNDPCIVLPDVDDIEEVARNVAIGAFCNTGQNCMAHKRIFVHQKIYKSFIKALGEAAKTLQVGDPNDKDTKLGPIQNAMQYNKIKNLFADTKNRGYKFLGSSDIKESSGYYIQPTIIDNPPDNSRVVTEEAFGPIVPCLSWSNEEEVIRRANDTKAGLTATIWGKDLDQCRRIADRIEAGSVYINRGSLPDLQAAFGGWKESGLGYEWGPNGIKAYMNMQVRHESKPGGKSPFA